ncbi:MAG: virulence factor [Alphaproteobacteria bacterium]|jgi:hypothetical protein|nr:virulence factor [Alphaproteobacteria bacterium]MDP6819267.1 virulence factor [Alphaproteobacteria bacterium]
MSEDSEAAPGRLVIMYWRDIPAQLLATAGRVKARRELTPRFQAAIDAAAMKCGAHGTDDYLEGWRKGAPRPCGGDLEAAVEEAAAGLERDYDKDRLARLISSGGGEDASGQI